MKLTSIQIIAIAVVAVVAVGAVAGYVVLADDDNSDNSSDDSSTTSTYGTVEITTLDADKTSYTQTFTEVPDHVVVGCMTALNMFLYFGLADNIVGVYYAEEDPWSEVQDEYDALVERIGSDHVLTGNIQQSVLTNWEPDLIVGWYSGYKDGGIGDHSYWNDLGCNLWALHSMSDNKTVDGMREDYENLGKIFDISDQTDAYMDSFDEKLTSLQGTLSDSSLSFAIYDDCNRESQGTYWFYGEKQFIGSVLAELGATNVFPSGGSVSAAVTYENVANIDVLFFVCYSSYTYVTYVSVWEGDSTLCTAPAIVNGNTSSINLSVAYGGSPQIIETLDFLISVLSDSSTTS